MAGRPKTQSKVGPVPPADLKNALTCCPILPVTLDLSELDWHRVSIDEALRRLAVAPKTGLDVAQAQRRAAQYGANQISPPPKRVLRKVVGWVFGGFGSLLLAASIVCFIAWYDILSRPPFFLNGISNG
jgi:hypothetical protein